MKQAFPFISAVFGAVIVALAIAVSQQKPKKQRKPKPAAEVTQSDNKAFEAGFTAGFLMAKTGAKRPSADDVDAMARRESFESAKNGGPAFAHNWKTGFWMGWSRGD